MPLLDTKRLRRPQGVNVVDIGTKEKDVERPLLLPNQPKPFQFTNLEFISIYIALLAQTMYSNSFTFSSSSPFIFPLLVPVF